MKVENAYQVIYENPRRRDLARDVLKILNETSEFDIGTQASALTDDQFTKIATWVADAVRERSVIHSMVLGAEIYLLLRAAEYGERGNFVDEFAEEVNISRSQLYRLSDMHRGFGKVLWAEETLSSCFVVESLKRLSAAGTAEAAREEAIAMARSGTRITIKVADTLIRKHREVVERVDSPEVDTQNQQAGQPAVTRAACEPRIASPKSKVLWRYSDALVRVLLEPASPGKAVNIEAMTFALEAALEKIRGEFEPDDAASADTQCKPEVYVDVE